MSKNLKILAITFTLVGVVFFLIPFGSYIGIDIIGIVNNNSTLFTATIITLLISTLAINYLEKDKSKKSVEISKEKIEPIIETIISNKIKEKISENQTKITDEEKFELLRDLKTKINNETNERFLTDLKNEVKLSTQSDDIIFYTRRTLDRLNSEIHSLVRRSNLNLVIGMALSFYGIAALFYFLSNDPTTFLITKSKDIVGIGGSKTIEDLFINFIPKAMFVILIEIFAYFFLNLYKKSLNDIKYYQNELTNIECKYLALTSAKYFKNHKLIYEILIELVKTERNFVLEAGQSTIEIEKEKISSSNSNNLLNMMKDILSSKK